MKKLLLTVLLATLFALAAPGAQAADVEDLQISPSNPVAEGNYEGGPLPYQGNQAGDQETHSPTTCRTALYCDTIDLDVTVPEGYEEDFDLRVTLRWAQDDLDMYFYNSQERLLAGAATSANPEVFKVAYMDPGRFHIVVIQFDTLHAVYNVKAEFLVRTPVVPKKRSTTTALSSSSGSGSARSDDRDPSFGQDFGGTVGGVIPIGEIPPSVEPIELDIPDDESGSVGFAPLEVDDELASSIRFDGGRVSVGLISLAVMALLSYFLFFVPRKDPVRRLEPAA